MRMDDVKMKMGNLVLANGVTVALEALLDVVATYADEDQKTANLKFGLKKIILEYKRQSNLDEDDGA